MNNLNSNVKNINLNNSKETVISTFLLGCIVEYGLSEFQLEEKIQQTFQFFNNYHQAKLKEHASFMIKMVKQDLNNKLNLTNICFGMTDNTDLIKNMTKGTVFKTCLIGLTYLNKDTYSNNKSFNENVLKILNFINESMFDDKFKVQNFYLSKTIEETAIPLLNYLTNKNNTSSIRSKIKY